MLTQIVYPPQVSQKQMLADLSTPKFEWDHPSMHQAANSAIEKQVQITLYAIYRLV